MSPSMITAAPRPYVPPKPGTLPQAWLVDIDGTLALMQRPGGRSPYDWTRVGEDSLNRPVAALVHALANEGYEIILMSGRDEVCREQTEAWLREKLVPYDQLHMRPEGDMRPDVIVKAELFDAHVRDRYDVTGVIDDREKVVAMWRAMGLTVAQVAEGKF